MIFLPSGGESRCLGRAREGRELAMVCKELTSGGVTAKPGRQWEELPDKVAMQLNDTHPSIAVAELMRLLMDKYQVRRDRCSWWIGAGAVECCVARLPPAWGCIGGGERGVSRV